LLRVSGDITPTANVSYDLGNNTNRFNDLYLSGSTIELGSQSITSNATHTAFTNSISATTFLGNVSGNVSGVLSGDAGNVSNVQGANVSGAVAFSTTANAVAGANVSGAVAFATTANAVAGANVSGAVSFATTANAVAGANVSGAVAFATTANAVAGGNVSGAVASATTATTAGTVTTAAQPNITSTGTLTALDVSGTADIGTVETAVLTTGASGTTGEITGNWSLSAGSRLTATYADLAEYYKGEEAYQPGTVVCFGGREEVHISVEKCSKRVAGVVSTNPAYLMNSTCSGIPVAVALQGRVPCKVTGKCEKGDVMVSAGDGTATAWYNVATIMQPGVVIGKSIEDKNDAEESVIEVAIGRL
jgi:hypothetical protein